MLQKFYPSEIADSAYAIDYKSLYKQGYRGLLFTDVYGANRAGIKSYFVKPIGPKEEIQIVLKRYLERIVLYFYRRQNKLEAN